MTQFQNYRKSQQNHSNTITRFASCVCLLHLSITLSFSPPFSPLSPHPSVSPQPPFLMSISFFLSQLSKMLPHPTSSPFTPEFFSVCFPRTKTFLHNHSTIYQNKTIPRKTNLALIEDNLVLNPYSHIISCPRNALYSSCSSV